MAIGNWGTDVVFSVSDQRVQAVLFNCSADEFFPINLR